MVIVDLYGCGNRSGREADVGLPAIGRRRIVGLSPSTVLQSANCWRASTLPVNAIGVSARKAVPVERDGPFEIAHSEGDGADGGFHAVQSTPRAAGGRRGLSARRR